MVEQGQGHQSVAGIDAFVGNRGTGPQPVGDQGSIAAPQREHRRTTGERQERVCALDLDAVAQACPLVGSSPLVVTDERRQRLIERYWPDREESELTTLMAVAPGGQRRRWRAVREAAGVRGMRIGQILPDDELALMVHGASLAPSTSG